MPKPLLFTTAWCADCTRAKRFLDEHGVTYDEIDIDKSETARARMIELANGRKNIPTILIGTTVLIEPSLDELYDTLCREHLVSC